LAVEAISLALEARNEKGGASGARLRRDGQIPAVVYGRNMQTQLATISDREYTKSRSGSGIAQLYRFTSANKDLNGKLALIKDVQIEPLKGKTIHVDFLAIGEDQLITLSVPVELAGESPSVKAGDAVLNQSAHEIRIECVPTKIPAFVTVDINELVVGHSIHAGEIPLPEGVKLKSDPEITIVSVVHKKDEVEAAPVAAAAEGAAATAEGAAAPADAKATEGAKAEKGK